ncbi:ATP-binding cassette domain-containing protein [Streptomyces roseolus]|uniref:ATP-binding cassette domain-containing protein n=1 Tax=Streptomyces roseolus TaxID=67358 RepID=UPI0019A47D49|nr:ABC transporter ATP-binding protein [Streptomyces roseolus]GGR46568.1 ABC transporter ATP-binding protein [Streptomyces roseolus]
MSTIVGAREPVRLAGVGRRYGPRGPWVLRGVDAELPAGRLVRVAGANGTGKSTLLRLVAGVDAPAEGRITGRPARTAYVPERFPPALPFTARDYLVHLGRVQGLRTGPARARAGEWLARFGAEAYAGTPLTALSKGTAQKVAVAQALLADPELLVLDEAWTGLDPEARAELDAAVRERVAAGATALFVDHDPHRLAGEPDTTLTVGAGRVLADAPPPVPALLRSAAPVRAPSPVRIVASGDRPLPDPLPGGAAGAPLAADGAVLFHVAAAHSDDLLRALLAAAWHVHRVEPLRAGADGGRP